MSRHIFLTGASGYIAKHIIVDLLNAGHSVRGSIRTPNRAEEVRAAVRPHLTDPASLSRLDFVLLDLASDEGWDSAMLGCDVLMHTASPFPMAQPKNPQDVIAPAVNGTLRALQAAQAAGISRVILTSSTVAITGNDLPDGKKAYDEEVWTDPDRPTTSPYGQSKTLAERAAWDFAHKHGLALITVNPGFVLGAPLDRHYGTSIAVVERILRAKDPMMPRLSFGSVDVQDVAALHLAALEDDGLAGQRIMAVAGPLWMRDMALAIKAALPHRRIVTRLAPDVIVRFLGLFDPAIRSIVPDLGRQTPTDNARATAILGRELRDPGQAAVATARWLDDHGIV